MLQYWALLVKMCDSRWYKAIIENSGTPFQTLSATCFKYEHYGLIHITNLYTYYLLLGFPCLNLFPAQKIRNKIVEVSFVIPGASTEQHRDLRINPIVESGIGFYWNSTGTQVAKFIRYSTQYVLSWYLVLVRGVYRKPNKELSLEKRLFIVILVKFLANGIGQTLGRVHQSTTY